jgi:hypothetical protein
MKAAANQKNRIVINTSCLLFIIAATYSVGIGGGCVSFATALGGSLGGNSFASLVSFAARVLRVL